MEETSAIVETYVYRLKHCYERFVEECEVNSKIRQRVALARVNFPEFEDIKEYLATKTVWRGWTPSERCVLARFLQWTEKEQINDEVVVESLQLLEQGPRADISDLILSVNSILSGERNSVFGRCVAELEHHLEMLQEIDDDIDPELTTDSDSDGSDCKDFESDYI